MQTIGKRIKQARKNLHLSEKYVANALKIPYDTYDEIESGYREVSMGEILKISNLLGVSTDELLRGKSIDPDVQAILRDFDSLNKADKNEVLNTIEYKKRMRENKEKN
jgi:transcriptional regulator with XRE-family HTH domain